MAREPRSDQSEEVEEEQEEPKKSGGMMKWIIIVVVVVVLCGGGFAAWWFFFSGGTGGGEHSASAEKAQQSGIYSGPIVPLKTFIVNLADPGGRRYLKVSLELELDKKETEEEVKNRLPEMRDQIILALSSKTFQQIQGVAGKTVLREELTARLNSILKSGKIKKTFFTEFVVQ